MARKKNSSDAVLAHDVVPVDDVFGSIFDGSTCDIAGVMTSEESEQRIIGIPLPGLAARVLFGQDVLALGRALMVYGKWGSCKSALMYEIYRWVHLNMGGAFHVETENKDSPDLRNSILEYRPAWIRNTKYAEAQTQEEWMEKVSALIKGLEGKFAKVTAGRRSKKKAGETAAEYRERTAAKVNDRAMGWTHPFAIGVDSLTGVSSDGSVNQIRDNGAPERGFSWEAQALSKFCRAIPSLLRNRPLLFVCTNHLKEGQDAMGRPEDVIPGGRSIRFMNTLELKSEKIGQIEDANGGGVRLKLRVVKNSLGETGHAAFIHLKWWYETDPETGHQRQRTVWDWAGASIETLLAQKSKSAGHWKAVNEVVDLHEATQKRIWSKALGIKQDKPVKYHEAGRILEERQDLLEGLYDVLHIRRRSKFVVGTPYEDIEQQLSLQAEAAKKVYAFADDVSRGDALDEGLAEVSRKKKKARVANNEDDDPDE